jgi:hypothetical protein
MMGSVQPEVFNQASIGATPHGPAWQKFFGLQAAGFSSKKEPLPLSASAALRYCTAQDLRLLQRFQMPFSRQTYPSGFLA